MPTPDNSLGSPSTGGFPQYWGNDIFQSWGISPVLGKCAFFFSDFDNEDRMLWGYSFFSECKISYWLWKYFIYGVYQKYFWSKCQNFIKLWMFSPSTGEFSDFWGKYNENKISPALGESKLKTSFLTAWAIQRPLNSRIHKLTNYEHLALFDSVWLCMTLYAFVWVCMTLHVSVWLYMTLQNSL